MIEWICLKCHSVFSAGGSYAKCGCGGELSKFSPEHHGRMLISSSNGWQQIAERTKVWEELPLYQEVRQQLWDDGCMGAARILIAFVDRLIEEAKPTLNSLPGLGDKMKTYLSGKLHNATVTEARLDYIGSVTIDEELAEMAGFEENEQVHIWDITNGSRIITYVIFGPRGGRDIAINGGAAHLIHVGDRVVIASFIQLTRQEMQGPRGTERVIRPNIIILQDNNEVEE